MKVTLKDALSIPNLMGYFRLILIPVFAYTYLTADTMPQYYMSVIVLGLSGLTDLFDGKIARRFNMITELGKFLDPVADKLTLGVVFLCMTTRYPWLWLLVCLYVVKEGFMGVMGLITLRCRGKKLDGAMWFGKVCTACSYGVLLLLLLFPEMPSGLANTLIFICAADMAFTLMMYIPKFREMWKQV